MTDFDRIAAIFRKHGCTEIGICPFHAVSTRLLPCRAAGRLPTGTAGLVMTVFPYAFADESPRQISRYACVPDYHVAAGNVLKTICVDLRKAYPAFAFEAFMDNSPIPEVFAAATAGLGVVGDHGLLIHPRFGSFVFIGCVATDLTISAPSFTVEGCPHCGRCSAACPGGCIGMGKETCLSGVSQQKKPLTAEQQQLLLANGSAWGCDTCQNVCSLNKQVVYAPHPCFTWYRPRVTEEDLADLSDKAYGWRGEAVIRRNLELFKR